MSCFCTARYQQMKYCKAVHEIQRGSVHHQSQPPHYNNGLENINLSVHLPVLLPSILFQKDYLRMQHINNNSPKHGHDLHPYLLQPYFFEL